MQKKRVTIVAMGGSRTDFLTGVLIPDTAENFLDGEVWAINHASFGIRADRVIHMDPLDHPDMKPIYSVSQWEKLRKGPPIWTCKHVDGFPTVLYPLESVLESIGGLRYLNTTVAYAIALALHEGATDIGLFGCDFTYPDVHTAESGRGCAEFWLGVACAKGVRILVSANSTLMDMREGQPLYGYSMLKSDG